MIKSLPAMQETWVQSLGQEDPLEKGMAAHSSTLAWRIPWTEELGGLQSLGSRRIRHNTHSVKQLQTRLFYQSPYRPKKKVPIFYQPLQDLFLIQLK